MSDIDYIVRDLQQRMANMIRRGRVHSVDFSLEPPRVRVEYEPNVQTDWLPFISGRASQEKTEWEPLGIGEQVIIFSEGGSLSCGIVVPALHDSKNSVPSRSPDEHVTRYQDGTTMIYNRSSHNLTITIGSGGNAELTCKTFRINADIEHVGNQTTSGNLEVKQDVKVQQNLTVTQAIKGQSVSDEKRTMSKDREIFNTHDHNHGDPKTSKPNQQM
ncbi:phage baseplate assembly protein V [Vibrio cholerae]